MSARGLTLATLASLCMLAGVCAFAGLAQAAVTHEYLAQITSVPSTGPKGEAVPSAGPIAQAQAMTVDSGELYVADGSAESVRVDRFDAATGAFEAQLTHAPVHVPPLSYMHQGIAVGHATGETEVYVGTDSYPAGSPEGAVAVFSASGELQAVWEGADTPAKDFQCFQCGGPGDVAVDNSTSLGDWAAGDVYVSVPLQGVVDVFKPSAKGGEEYVTQLTGPEPKVPFGGPYAVSVDQANGDVLVTDGTDVDIFEPTLLHQYALVRRLTGTPAGPFAEVPGVAVDGGDGDIYVSESSEVDQFASDGTYLGRLTGTPAAPFSQIQAGAGAIAVDPATHRLYVENHTPEAEPGETEPIEIFGPNLVIPDVTSGPATNVKPFSATLTGTVDPDEAGQATCQFLWGTSTAFGHTAPCEPAQVPNGSSPQPVRSALGKATGSELEPDTTYYYRLQATNGNGSNPGEQWQDQHFTTPGPGLHGESIADVAATSATLQATIDPHEAPTTYYFQYGPTGAYGAEAPALSASAPRGQSIGSAAGDVEVAQHLQGLQAGTTYHYRVVAVSEAGPGLFEAFDGPDRTFVTQTVSGAAVPADGRSWEMVSPPEKYGANLSPISEQDGVIQAAAGGDALTYVSNTPVEAQPQGFAGKVQELSTRGPSGWAPVTITVPHTAVSSQPVGYGAEYRLFSEDLSLAAIQPIGVFNPALSTEASEQTAFLRSTYVGGDVADPCTSSCYKPLATGRPGYANVLPGTVFGGQDGGERFLSDCRVGCGPNFVGATPDMSHVVISAEAGLTSGPGSHGGLYEWSDGQLTFIGGGTVGNHSDEADKHSISDDGSRVIIDGQAEGVEGLLMRETTTGEVVKLDAVQGGSGEGFGEARFQAASSDGSRVFFTDAQRLTKDAGRAKGVAEDLYECEIVKVAGRLACELSDLTPPTAGESADVQGGLLGVSEDGSWVYFVADGRLGADAVHGKPNLYVLHHDGTGWEPPKLIAALSEADSHDWDEHISGQPAGVAPDGEWLAFMSEAPLTGYDNRDALTGAPDAEVYLYDAQAGRLLCASCDPTGARPIGREYSQLEPGSGGLVGGPRGIWEPNALVAANLPGWQHTNISERVQDYQSRYLSDGGRLFFNSDDALVPNDVNGTEDVYEYEPPGVGSCGTGSVTFSERSGGCVGLISSGTSPTESGFLDASEGGGDVFFITAEQLAPQDMDTSLDIYDAHECTAQVPCTASVAAPPPCVTGDACKPAPTPQPSSFGAPASATFSGAGNVTPASGRVTVRKSPTRAQKLGRALKACRKESRKRRVTCERKARRRYAAKQSRKGNAKRKKG